MNNYFPKSESKFAPMEKPLPPDPNDAQRKDLETQLKAFPADKVRDSVDAANLITKLNGLGGGGKPASLIDSVLVRTTSSLKEREPELY